MTETGNLKITTLTDREIVMTRTFNAPSASLWYWPGPARTMWRQLKFEAELFRVKVDANGIRMNGKRCRAGLLGSCCTRQEEEL